MAMESTTLIFLLLVALIWYDSMQARERCLTLARRTSLEMNVQLLDDTIALTTLALKRDQNGRLRLRRIYEFRILDNFLDIQHCTIILLGSNVQSVLINTGNNKH